MSRVDDNNELLDRLRTKKFTDTDLALVSSVLIDISQSLAIIADAHCIYRSSETKLCGGCKYWEEDDDNPNSHCYNCHNMDKWEDNDEN